MANDITFTMIKPEAVASGYTGAIIDKIIGAGFTVSAMRMTQLSRRDAEKFYEVHKERPFYGELVDYIISGHVVAIMLTKANAVVDFRKLIGATDPSEAEEGTIRKLYAQSKEMNAIHGSDSDENAHIECGFFFSETERY